MQKYALAAVLIAALAMPALAAQYYVALDTTVHQCRLMSIEPDGTTMKMVGDASYPTLDEAQEAMDQLPECKS